MNKETFNEIISSLQRRVNFCKGMLGDIHTTEDLSQISLRRAAAIRELCAEEEVIMTKICMVDLYHIIGMGQLSPTQMMKFTYLMQDYLSYRPTIKVLAQHLNKIGELPNIPVKTRFKLLGLGDVTLTYGEGELIDEASVEDYTSLKVAKTIPDPPADLPFTITGNTIELELDKLDYFVELMEALFNVSLSVDNLRKKINGKGEYLGIQWNGIAWVPNGSCFTTGKITSANTRLKLFNYYNKNK
jgi:hypothetical protein